eukprot:c2966_g1_i1.p1 GENE.c2966_g1_i1~~c2966_g1_i1.p1  ORF type:complete len:330 (+),score=99.79 c2966_g1_i1:25-1014(+)
MLFRSSSHFNSWLFTKAQLNTIREQTNLDARKRIHRVEEIESDPLSNPRKHKLVENEEEEHDEVIMHPRKKQVLANHQALNKHIPDSSDAAFHESQVNSFQTTLTLFEEELIRSNYALKLLQFANAIKCPTKVKLTALTYFSRFYVKASVMDYPADTIWVICLSLACKVEENSKLSERVLKSCEIKNVLDWELIILQKLSFHLRIFRADRALDGLLIKWREQNSCPSDEKLTEIRKGAINFLEQIYVTDFSFLYPPGILAASSLIYVCDSSDEPSFGGLLSQYDQITIDQITNIKSLITLSTNNLLHSARKEELDQAKAKLQTDYYKKV